MEVIKTIRDVDIGSSEKTPIKYGERCASRAVVFDANGNVALLHATNKGFHKLPGGGVEEGEGVETALRREIVEEIGCSIENIRELGIVEEYRNGSTLHQVSYCFLADVQGEKGEPHLEGDEITDGFKAEWSDLEMAIKTLEGETGIENYEGKFIRIRDLSILKEAARILSTNPS